MIKQIQIGIHGLGGGVRDSKNLNLSRCGSAYKSEYISCPSRLAFGFAECHISIVHSNYDNLTIRNFRIVQPEAPNETSI